jgi:hypothetical protein
MLACIDEYTIREDVTIAGRRLTPEKRLPKPKKEKKRC